MYCDIEYLAPSVILDITIDIGIADCCTSTTKLELDRYC
jgi:hypothetical protein